ncbi:unnamed protein product [Gongylonema pulchrum]|uniref:DUF3456 domain-containing protein n=1 Tax=Gongylonema pulchrum TaxID=637853 RepID=A0A183EFW6_9BILA|nr:unnamed protein product [Gongylonema pulchrum]
MGILLFSLLVPEVQRITDDPAMMCSNLTDEYVRVAHALGLQPEEVFELSFSTTDYICKNLKSEERNYILSKFDSFKAYLKTAAD